MEEEVYGLVALDALTVSFPSITRARLAELYEECGTDRAIDFSKLNWADIPALAREQLITEQHELDHYAILTSTPAGVLLWRLSQVVTRDVGWILRTFETHGHRISPGEVNGIGLPEWLRSTGLALLAQSAKPASGSTQSPTDLARYLAAEVVPGLWRSLYLMEILTSETPSGSYPDLTRGIFAKLLNDTFDYVARRSDIELQNFNWKGLWISTEPDAPMFPPGEAMNLRTVFELLAYTQERQLMKMMRADQAALADHMAIDVPDIYRLQLTQWLDAAGGDENRLRQVLVEGLLGRTDIAAIGHAPGWDPDGPPEAELGPGYRQCRRDDAPGQDGRQVLYVESEWPSFRSERIRGWGMRAPLTARPMITLATLAGRSRLFGPDSAWEKPDDPDDVLAGAGLIYQTHLLRCDAAIREAHRIRYDGLYSFFGPEPKPASKGDYLRSILMFETADQYYAPYVDTLGLQEVISGAFFEKFNAAKLLFAQGRLHPDPAELEAHLISTGEKIAAGAEAIFATLPAGAVAPALLQEALNSMRGLFTLEFMERATRIKF